MRRTKGDGGVDRVPRVARRPGAKFYGKTEPPKGTVHNSEHLSNVVDTAAGGLNLRNLFKLMSRVAPQFILNRFSKPVEAMVVDSTSP